MAKGMFALLAIMPLAIPAVAMAQAPADAIASLESAARVAPSDGGATIELANAYWRAGRTAEANNNYRRALALDNVMMETKLGDPIWSHEVARRQLASVTVASR